ncbi:response regulator transcription factor [Halomonas elongata]|uniref:Response regulator transcription factor n=2 Tax=Halomonas elongata TaxID=2746 RepID=E1V7A9_HALED|nr:response regulator transcription factor [Halomonas elongata]MBW5801075.1 response regulator transcription factor [Halomonas elongata]MDL4861698.1 response regulator transcription factor [Halomonas elongata]OBX37745.1 transcriptional regulatory protein QseB [Halomonas elongata]RAW07518.1 DNA-binding response regulator [Halomonas elongata]WBF18695.1 response regulator transcription factor [Halomonas elongata]
MRVLLVEDDPLLGDGIRTALQREGYAVDWLETGRDGIAAIRHDDFSAVILDLGLPDIDGMEVLDKIRHAGSLPVLILTARDAVESRISGLDGGADDYVLKPFDLQELLARLRVIMRRAEGRSSRLLEVGELCIDEARHRVSWQGNDISLTRREYALLLELARHPGRVMTRPHLEDLLYGWEDEVASNAVEVHVHHLRKKLDRHLIATVRGVGYRLDTASE